MIKGGKNSLAILAFSVVVVGLLILPVSSGMVLINNSTHVDYSYTTGPLFLTSKNSSVEVSETNSYFSHLNFSGTMPYYKSGSSANFTDFGSLRSKFFESYQIDAVEIASKNISDFSSLHFFGLNSGKYVSLLVYKSSTFKGTPSNITQNKGGNFSFGLYAKTSTLSGKYVRYASLSLDIYIQIYTDGKVYQAFSYSMNLTLKING